MFRAMLLIALILVCGQVFLGPGAVFAQTYPADEPKSTVEPQILSTEPPVTPPVTEDEPALTPPPTEESIEQPTYEFPPATVEPAPTPQAPASPLPSSPLPPPEIILPSETPTPSTEAPVTPPETTPPAPQAPQPPAQPIGAEMTITGTVEDIAADSSYIVVGGSRILTTEEFLLDSYLEKGDKVEITAESTEEGWKVVGCRYILEETPASSEEVPAEEEVESEEAE